MEKKAFDLIVELVAQALAQQEFQQQDVSFKQEDGRVALFTSETLCYSIVFDRHKKRFELRSCGMTDEGPDNEWKSISVWLFDPDNDTERQAEGIAHDFIETIEGPKRKALAQASKKKTKKDEDGNVDPQFFMNRLIVIFPELRDELTEEKNRYGRLRGVTFAQKKVLPKMQALFSSAGEGDRQERLIGILCDMYGVGDMDVRSIITIVLLNGLEGEKAKAALEEYMTDDMKKAYKAALRFKGKTVKPEKPKKQKRFVADTLDSKSARKR